MKDREAVAQSCSVKKVFLEISQNSQENTCVRVSFLIKLQAWTCNFVKKETLAQVFSCEFCEISKGRVTRTHISEILYLVIFPKYYSCIYLIVSNGCLAAAQSKR